jgi:hypothetical protein
VSDPKSGEPASAVDPFASAKANLRDTVKWLATTFAALAAVVLAGTSLTGLSHLTGLKLAVALIGGGGGLACVILAAGVMLRLLTSESFYVTSLETPQFANLKDTLNRHSEDILPPELVSVDQLLQLRRQARQTARSLAGTPTSPQYLDARRFLTEIEPPMVRLTNLAHFEVLRNRMQAAEPTLFRLAIGALVGLGVFAVFAGSKDDKSTADAQGPTVVLYPGKNWSDIAGALAQACGSNATPKAQLLAGSDPQWARIRLLAPEACAGVIVPLPTPAVAPVTSPRVP